MTTTLKLWFSTIRTTLINLRALFIFAIIYALLLVTAYVFISTREATVWQVFITYAFLILIPAEFFIFQASIIDHVRDQEFRWRAILIDALKFFVATIPMLLIAWLLYYLLNKVAGRFPAPLVPTLPIVAGPPRPQPLHWPILLFATLRFVLFGVALPLAAIHLWIAVAGDEIRSAMAAGAKPLLKKIGAAMARAFAFESVLIYALGLIVFFVLPYLVLFVPFSPKGNKTDFAVFVLRLLLTFIFSFIGWIVTVTTLARSGTQTSTVVSAAVSDVPAEAPA